MASYEPKPTTGEKARQAAKAFMREGVAGMLGMPWDLVNMLEPITGWKSPIGGSEYYSDLFQRWFPGLKDKGTTTESLAGLAGQLLSPGIGPEIPATGAILIGAKAQKNAVEAHQYDRARDMLVNKEPHQRILDQTRWQPSLEIPAVGRYNSKNMMTQTANELPDLVKWIDPAGMGVSTKVQKAMNSGQNFKGSGTLGQIFPWPELYDRYPGLEDLGVMVKYGPQIQPGGVSKETVFGPTGRVSSRGLDMEVQANDPLLFQQIAGHELNHIVQSLENRPRGGGPEMFETPVPSKLLMSGFQQHPTEPNSYFANLLKGSFAGQRWSPQEIEKWVDFQRNLYNKAGDPNADPNWAKAAFVDNQSPMTRYMLLTGEAESKLVEDALEKGLASQQHRLLGDWIRDFGARRDLLINRRPNPYNMSIDETWTNDPVGVGLWNRLMIP